VEMGGLGWDLSNLSLSGTLTAAKRGWMGADGCTCTEINQ
jgi:hypothetical protein